MDDSSVKLDQQLLKAYKSTNYHVIRPDLNIRVGEVSQDLNVFLMDNNAFYWAFITAWNPHSRLLDIKENEARHEELKQTLIEMKMTFLEGYGEGNPEMRGKNWPAEKSLMILDIPLKVAKRLGHRFQQNAILFGALNQPAELIWLEGASN